MSSGAEWFDDLPEEIEDLNRKGAQALARAGTGRNENIYKQGQLPEMKKNRIIFRLLTRKIGESYSHWYTLGTGQKTRDNCACAPEARANRLTLCPVCAYMDAGFGNPGKGLGYDNTRHQYLLLGLFGEIVEERVRTGKDIVVEETIVWDPDPKIFEITGTIYDGIWKWNNNPDYPVGAGGDITAVNWALWKEKGKRTEYFVEDHSVGPRPTHGEDAEHNQVEIDLGVAAMLRDQIINECAPTNEATLRAKISAQEPEEAPARRSAPSTAKVPDDDDTSVEVDNDMDNEEERPETTPAPATRRQAAPAPAPATTRRQAAPPAASSTPQATRRTKAPETVNPDDKF